MSVPRGSATLFAVSAIVLAAVAVSWPVPLMTAGLAVLGLAHVGFELRYIIGRFATTITARAGWALGLVLCLIALARVAQSAGFVTPGRLVEAVLGIALLGFGVALAWRGTPRLVGWGVVAAIGVAALVWPAWYAHVITHIHNLVPVLFLVDWARRRLPRAARPALYAATALWAFVIPGLILVGVLDSFTNLSSGFMGQWVPDAAKSLTALAPPLVSGTLALRYGVMFAFLQSMHYVVWLAFFPRAGRPETAAFERVAPILAGRRFLASVVAATVALLAVFAFDYGAGKAIYSVLASYHVYVEAPMALLLLASARGLPSRELTFTMGS